jgi:hypothetical protein
MRHEPCAYCGRKPKVYREFLDCEWHLDHDCLHLMGIAYLGGECKSDIVKTWNERVAENKKRRAGEGKKS